MYSASCNPEDRILRYIRTDFIYLRAYIHHSVTLTTQFFLTLLLPRHDGCRLVMVPSTGNCIVTALVEKRFRNKYELKQVSSSASYRYNTLAATGSQL